MGGSATKPTQNSRNEITTNNMEIGLVNLSSEQWDLSRAHRIELFLILFSIIILIIAIYKWRQKCRKKTCTKSNSLEMKKNRSTTISSTNLPTTDTPKSPFNNNKK